MHSHQLGTPVRVTVGKPNGHLTPVTQLPVSVMPLLSCLAADKAKKKKTNTVYIWHMQPLPVWKPARLKRSFNSFFFSVSNLPPGKLESAISGASEGRSCGCWIAPVAAELGMVDEGSAALADTLVCCFGCCWASNILLCVRLASRPCPTWPVVMY